MGLLGDAPNSDELDALMHNVGAWLALQSEETASTMARMQSAHLSLLASMDDVAETLKCDEQHPILTPSKSVEPHYERRSVDDADPLPATEPIQQTAPDADAKPTELAIVAGKPALTSSSSSPSREVNDTRPRTLPPTTPTKLHAVDITTDGVADTSKFSAIETVLAARRQRMTLQQREGSPQSGSGSGGAGVGGHSACDDGAPSPLAMASLDDVGDCDASATAAASSPSSSPAAISQNPLLLLRTALLRWRRRSGVPPIGEELSCHPTDVAMAAAAAPRIARAACLRRWAAGTRVASAREKSRRDAVLHTTRLGWKGWREATARAAQGKRDAATRDMVACDAAARSASTRALGTWRAHACKGDAVRCAAEAAATRTAHASRASGLRAWSQWMRRRAAWRRCVERRADAHGGAARQHLPCMRNFDARAIFVEEGSHGVATAYRRRRTLAVVLCAWFGVAVGATGTMAADVVGVGVWSDDVVADAETEVK